MYVFDSSPLIVLFRHYYPNRFPTLWEKFDILISDSKLSSVRDVVNEINRYANSDRLTKWVKDNRNFFPKSTTNELLTVRKIFQVKHFQSMIREKERLQGYPVADPFVVAKAKACNGCVVTLERRKENSAKLPNVCDHFGILCIDLEEFMEKEGWIF
ncbi:DUF4411 family protein [candidate division WOR-3 bacterium]|nr:DUF4411 family protein [candidate division WOR-3 bacterium]